MKAFFAYKRSQRDEDFDTSYESLLSLAATLGDVKPRCTSESVIASLPTGLYRDWATPDSDARCPICLDDVCASDLLSLMTLITPLLVPLSINQQILCSS